MFRAPTRGPAIRNDETNPEYNACAELNKIDENMLGVKFANIA